MLGIVLATSGCSFKFLHPAPPSREWPDPVTPNSSEERCTVAPGVPIVDTLVGASTATLGYLERNSGGARITPGLGITTLAFTLVAIPFLESALYGYVETSRCRRYHAVFHPSE
jgi:hypothetical protein